MLIEQILPQPDFHETHGAEYEASPSDTMHAVHELDMGGSLVTRLLLALRGLPTRGLRITDLTNLGFMVVADREDEIVFGLVAKPWRWGGDVKQLGVDEFAAFAEPGYAKIAWSFHVAPATWNYTRLTTETRVSCTDSLSRRLFHAYWLAIRPFSGMIRREALRLLSAALGG